MLDHKPSTQHVPPHHPNWTGRAHRTLEEAFGAPVPLAERRPYATRLEVAIYVVCLFALAVVAAILVGES